MQPGDTITYTGWADKLMGDGSWEQRQVTNLTVVIEEFVPAERSNYVPEAGFGCVGERDNSEWFITLENLHPSCPTCGGTGYEVRVDPDNPGHEAETKCRDCDGSGKKERQYEVR